MVREHTKPWETQTEALSRSTQMKEWEAYFEAHRETLLQDIIDICEVPAPTFHEKARAEWVADRLRQLELEDVRIDGHLNAMGRYPGQESVVHLIIVAHIDTVFPADVDVTVQRGPDRMAAPGIGDNSTSVAAMLHLVAAWRATGYVPPFDVMFVGNACEEGLGDLRGIRGLLDDAETDASMDVRAVLSIDGHLGGVTHAGIGSRRLRVQLQAAGGHSWGDFGSPSAIHAAGHIIASIDGLEVPTQPRTTYNVGVVEGGTSVNTIAERATMLIDMRSEGEQALQVLETQVRDILDAGCSTHRVTACIEVVGDRPVGRLPDEHPMLRIAQSAGRVYGLDLTARAGSTDANIPLSRGIPALTMGVYEGGNAHRLSEWMRPDSLHVGMPLLALTTLTLLEWVQGLEG